MSGIFGIFFFDNRPVDPTNLGRMADRLVHRGPDGADVWYHGSVGLGHRRLYTTPESLHETLPLTGQAGQLVLTADARIDNRSELIPLLGLNDRPAGEITDSDLILAAYQKWGEACLNKLVGDFAFAIWDERQQQLFCARDPMGIKPFYYYHDQSVFVFASEIKGLFCLPDVPRRLNELKVADHLAEIFEDPNITFYQDIFRLPAAHSYIVRLDQRKITRYWAPDLSTTLKLDSDEAYTEAFREIFSEAVKSRLRSAFPVGASLSGGLDSSSIVGTARNLNSDNKNPIKTFSLIFPDLPLVDQKQLDERKFINAVLSQGGLDPHFIRADQLSPFEPVRKTSFNQTEPVIFPNQFLHQALFKSAQQQNARIYLDGHNGDATISHGDEYLIELARTGHWLKFFSQASAFAKKYGVKRRKVMWSYSFDPLIKAPMRRLIKGKCPESNEKLSKSLINQDFARTMNLKARMQALCKEQQALTQSTSEMHWLGMYTGLSFLWRETTDQSAAMFSIEPRYPFCDKRLVEFCLNLPAAQKLQQGWDRIIMRRAMNNILPREVQWRPRKANLSPNFNRKLLEYEQATLDDIITGNTDVISKYVNVSRLNENYEQYLSNPTSSHAIAVQLFGVGTLALWLQSANVADKKNDNITQKPTFVKNIKENPN